MNDVIKEAVLDALDDVRRAREEPGISTLDEVVELVQGRVGYGIVDPHLVLDAVWSEFQKSWAPGRSLRSPSLPHLHITATGKVRLSARRTKVERDAAALRTKGTSP